MEYFIDVFNPLDFEYNPDDRVTIIDGDSSHHFPNLALQKISAWEKRNGTKNIKFIKLKHQRKNGILAIHPDSLNEVMQVKDYCRVYASFIFTRSKAVAQQLQKLIPHALIGGTGVDEYHEMVEGEYRAKPHKITQLNILVENMYPDHSLYESEFADMNVQFWTEPGNFKFPKKSKSVVETYVVTPKDGDWGKIDASYNLNISANSIVDLFSEYMNKYGYEDGTTYRGSTRGNGYSSKGCPRKCSFCVVPVIQGDIVATHYGLLGVINWILPINFYPTMDEVIKLYESGLLTMRPHLFWDSNGKVKRISPFLTVSDNNFTSDPTCLEKLAYMISNDIAVNFNQGMDARFLTAKERIKNGVKYPGGDDLCEKISKVHFMNFNGTSRQLHFAWDYIGAGKAVLNGLNKLVKDYGLKYSHFLVYCLSGFNSTFEDDYQRVLTLRKLGADPYIMLFRNVDGSEGTMWDGETPQDWREKHLARWTNNKILFKVTSFYQYQNYTNELKQRSFGTYNEEQEEMAKLECFDWLTNDYINHA